MNVRSGDLKARVTLVRTDLTVETEVQNFVQTTLDKFGQIDVLVNTVGGFVGGIPVAEMAEERWDFMMDLNLKSIFLCCKAVLPHMIERKCGKIVNTSARAGLSGIAGLGAYSVSKNGVRILTESIAEEVKDLGINVNSLLVSIIDTPANREGNARRRPLPLGLPRRHCPSYPVSYFRRCRYHQRCSDPCLWQSVVFDKGEKCNDKSFIYGCPSSVC